MQIGRSAVHICLSAPPQPFQIGKIFLIMYIVGIDIAKRKHEAAVIDGEGTVIIKPFSFTNNCSGYNRLLAMLAKAKLPLDEVSFAMEATGHYWLALFTRLQKEGFRVQVINPVQTNSIRSFYILAKINDGLLSSKQAKQP